MAGMEGGVCGQQKPISEGLALREIQGDFTGGQQDVGTLLEPSQLGTASFFKTSSRWFLFSLKTVLCVHCRTFGKQKKAQASKKKSATYFISSISGSLWMATSTLP